MTTLLHIDSSIFGDAGQSSRLARGFVEQWAEDRPFVYAEALAMGDEHRQQALQTADSHLQSLAAA